MSFNPKIFLSKKPKLFVVEYFHIINLDMVHIHYYVQLFIRGILTNLKIK